MNIKTIAFLCNFIIEHTDTHQYRLLYYLYIHGVKSRYYKSPFSKTFSQTLMLRIKTDRAVCRLLVEYGEHFSPHYGDLQKSYIQNYSNYSNLNNIFKEENYNKKSIGSINSFCSR